MSRRSLPDWLEYLERLHPQTIAMGLERVLEVKRSLALTPVFPLIAVGGTNGKGSCCAMLEAILRHAGYRVGCYTSPHLLRYNERVRIDGRQADDLSLCHAFAQIDAARGATTLTYFEFGTLAAVLLFVEAQVDIAILEVGLGGRLDAVNAFDADCALIASIDIDHTEYLGHTRDAIGYEKAGIARAGRPLVCADQDPPAGLVEHVRKTGAQLILRDRDFGCRATQGQWQYWGPGGMRHGLPHPALRGDYQIGNAAGCLATLDELRARVPVAAQDIRSGLLDAQVAARFQVLPGLPLVVLDVAHNPHAARALASNLQRMPRNGKAIAVFAMLKDKDIAGVVREMRGCFTHWMIAPAGGPRAAAAQQIALAVRAVEEKAQIESFDDVQLAYHAACNIASGNDKIIVFGSFLTVAAVLEARKK